MFRGCTNLTTITGLSNLNRHGLADSISNMFQDCTSLTNIDLSGWTNTNITGADGAFKGCTNLTSINLSG